MGFWDGSGISWTIGKQSAPRFRQATTSTPHHSFLYRLDALPETQPTVSKHWRHHTDIEKRCKKMDRQGWADIWMFPYALHYGRGQRTKLQNADQISREHRWGAVVLVIRRRAYIPQSVIHSQMYGYLPHQNTLPLHLGYYRFLQQVHLQIFNNY